jgi:hypothetical protein
MNGEIIFLKKIFILSMYKEKRYGKYGRKVS